MAVVHVRNFSSSVLHIWTVLNSLHRKLKVQSSANKIDENISEILGKSLINNKKHKQAKLEPCGIPTVNGRGDEILSQIRTDYVLLDK